MLIKHKAATLFKRTYKLLCTIIPTNKKRVVFISYPDASDNSWHLYKYMGLNCHGWQYVWLCSEPGSVEKKLSGVLRRNNSLIVCKKKSLKGLWMFLTSSHVFHTHGTYFFASKSSFGPVIINLWHGMPIKKIGYLDGKSSIEVAYSDFAISTSSFYSKILAESFRIGVDRVLPLGLPRNDVMFNFDADRKKSIFNKLNLPEQRKLIFWLPTYRTSTVGDIRKDALDSSFLDEWSENVLSEVNRAAEACDCYIIVKIHPMDQLNSTALQLNLNRIKLLKLSDWQHLDIDLYDALSCSDALITDISSVLIDYLPTAKPLAITVNSTQNYSRGTIFELDKIFKSCFTIKGRRDFIYFINNLTTLNIERSEISYLNDADIGSPPSCEKILRRFGLS